MSLLEFQQRLSKVTPHGIGLSVDLYTPDLGELLHGLMRAGQTPDYLEVFKAADAGLHRLKQQWPRVPWVYHAEGLWVTQPDLVETYPFEEELSATASQLAILQASWLTHECASKQMAGYAFGTYLPPLFSLRSAEVTAENTRLVQARLDAKLGDGIAFGPLFLLETPPLTYFAFDNGDVAEFFTAVTDRAACGLVLDIGHLWTIYRYTESWQRSSLTVFLEDFLNRFPLERVVQIHLAGLGPHCDASPGRLVTGADPSGPAEPPWWIDAHEHPIPEILLDMLEQVLRHPRLVHLKGVALEVDNKSQSCIIQEFERFTARFAGAVRRCQARLELPGVLQTPPATPGLASPGASTDLAASKRQLEAEYGRYARAVSGQCDQTPGSTSSRQGLALYRQRYLPHEICRWGGDLTDMFPETCRQLEHAGIGLTGFPAFWFREPRCSDERYDFFLLKIDRFIAYVAEVLPDSLATVHEEAVTLREAYAVACG